MMDEDELAKLLGRPREMVPPKPYQPLARNTSAQKKCFHCGSEAHPTHFCPSKPTLRERPPRRGDQQPESIADAAQQWRQTAGADLEVAKPPTIQEEADRRARNLGQDRRRNKFDIDEPEEVKNRYELPERRRGGQGKARRMRQEEDEDDGAIERAERKRLRQEAKKAAKLAKATAPTPIYLPQYISVANLASMLKQRAEDFVRKLEELGFEEVQTDHILNAEHAGLVAQEYNFEPVFPGEEEDGDLYASPEMTPEEYANLPARPPVVTIMGHVDHGKTTILDYMRSTSVAATEFGGITQHIGAFSVPLASGKKITFLDTPGHSAFETMRARGANVTDIVVLVVAADDSVMPQTIEALKHAQAAKVPIIVAINKIDKQQADPDAVKLDLGRHGIEIEDFGGDVQAICVSGKTGQGIPDLEEAISTLSELLDHRADPSMNVEGWVLEGSTKKSGRVATVLVRSGTLRQGTTLVAGTTWTRVRTLRNEAGVVVPEAGPGIAVEVDGWRDQPIAGDEVLQAADEQQAASVSEIRTDKVEREQLARDMTAINESRRLEAERREALEAAEKAAAAGEAEGEVEDTDAAPVEVKEKGPEVVSFIIKGDVSGSVEAVIDSVSAIGNGEVSPRILRHGVGSPSEFDIAHASAASGHIINFNTPIPPNIARLAEEAGVKILDSNIIYRVVETVKDLLSEKLAPSVIQKVTGEAEIAAIFSYGLGGRKKIKVAGSKVRNGFVEKGTKARVLRGSEVVHDGKSPNSPMPLSIFDGIVLWYCSFWMIWRLTICQIGTVSSLKNQKKDVDQMRKDTECGIGFQDWDGFAVGDRIQCYEERFEKRSL
jgi:translation initiation factor IF-2